MQNFLRQGALPPYSPRQMASFLDPCEHLPHRLSFPQFKIEWRPCMWITWRAQMGEGRRDAPQSNFWWPLGEMSHSGEFKIGGSMESLVEMVYTNWESLQNYVNSTLGNRFSWAFKTLKPISFRGLGPLDPRCHDGISDENSTNRQFSAKLYVNSAPDLTL